MTRTLIVFYSLEGSTKLIAETLRDVLRADILEIKPKKEIKTRGFMKYLWGGRQVIMNIIPELKPFEIDMAAFDAVIIGTPVWAFNYSPPIRAFLSKMTIKGKKVALYCTHEGTPAKTLGNLMSALEGEGNAVVGTKDFVNVARNKEMAITAACEWAEKIKKEL